MTTTPETPDRRTRILTRSDVARLLDLDDCIAAVEDALRRHARGDTLHPGVLGVPARDGGFHIKAAGLTGGRARFAVKCNGNFPRNGERFGLPTIQGLVLLCDADHGLPLAVIDSIEITILRTGAATAVAARHLAREDAGTALICGCGNQGRVQALAFARVRPIGKVLAWDADPARADRFASQMPARLGVPVEAVRDLPAAARTSDVIVTCTPSTRPILSAQDVRPGTFIAAVGADSEEKQECDPRLFATARVVVDSLAQCAAIGDLHHALEAGAIAREDVHAELHECVAGTRPGRTTEDEITLFDSTGIALQDVAAAVVVYERALAQGAGILIDFAG